MNLFTKSIQCSHCHGNFKRRRNRSKYVWICGRRENGYTNCPRVQIDEEFLIRVILNRYEIRWGKQISENEIREKVEQIIVEDKLLFTIKLIDFDDPIVYGRESIVY